jgi:hypothetical protein
VGYDGLSIDIWLTPQFQVRPPAAAGGRVAASRRRCNRPAKPSVGDHAGQDQQARSAALTLPSIS